MTNWVATDPAERPALETREPVAGYIEARCPCCHQWRPAFTIAPTDDPALRGADWACDGDRTRWARGGS